MTNKPKAHVFVVDDDSCICEAISLYLKSVKIKCTCFSNADDSLRQLRLQRCDLLITDVKMPDKSGIELLSEVKRIVPWLPVLVMTSYANIPQAVKAIKAGAIDFIEKPLQWDSLLATIQSVLEQNNFDCTRKGKPLTKTELIVLRLVLQDKSNKEIANILSRSVRTIEVHRSHIMRKLDVNSVVELVKRAAVMGFDDAK